MGNLIHIQSQTASNSASISFTTGINSTYKEYQFYFIDIHPRTNRAILQFNMSTDGGSNYNVTKTSTDFYTINRENDGGSNLAYDTDQDLAQSTSFDSIVNPISSDADGNGAGYMTLFNPSSTTYVKHYISVTNVMYVSAGSVYASVENFVAGYGNTTSAINAIQFKMDSGNFDGTIALFGVV